MSGIFPSTPAARSVRMASVQPSRESVSHSLRRQVRTTNAQRWTLELEFSPMERADLAPIFAFLVAQRGRYDTFQYVLPAPLNTPRGTGVVGSPSPWVDGAQVSPTNDAQTGRSIVTRGWAVSTAILMAGDFVQFGSHSKVYMIRENVTSDSSTRATLLIEPAIQLSGGLANLDQIVTTNIPFTVALENDINEFALDIGPFFRVKMNLMEVY